MKTEYEFGRQPAVDFHLVIPCFRESARLPHYLADLVPLLAAQPFRTRILVVDDGSSVDEQRRLETIVAGVAPGAVNVAASHLERNMGKGYAVRHGWAAAQNARWLAFADADGATPAREIVRVFDAIYHASDPRRCYFASRIRMLGRSVDRQWKRHVIGRLYATLVGTLIDERIYDSQCGFKVIPAEAFATIGGLLQENRFAFDSELIVALADSGYPFEEVPIDWTHVPGSKVSLVRDSIGMVASLFAIRRRRRAGAYRHAAL